MKTFDEDEVALMILLLANIDPNKYKADETKALLYKIRSLITDNGDGTSAINAFSIDLTPKP